MKHFLYRRLSLACLPMLFSILSLAGCLSPEVHITSCFSDEVATGQHKRGTCDFEGFLVTSGGTMLMVESYEPEAIRTCLENNCLSVSYWVDDVNRIAWGECEPTKLAGTAHFKYMPDKYATIGDFEPRLDAETIACDFPTGFYHEAEN